MSHSPTQLCVYVCECVEGCFVLLADSSPPRVGPGRCRGVTMLINCLRSPVCVAACLPCRRVLGGFRVAGSQWKEWRGRAEKVREGGDNRGTVCGSLCSCKWCHAINPASSAMSVWTAVSSCWTRLTASRGLAGPCALTPFPDAHGAALCSGKRGANGEVSGSFFFFFFSFSNRWYLAQLLLLGKLKPLMIVCRFFFQKELEPLKRCEEICN